MSFESLPSLPLHSSSEREGDHDGTIAPDALPAPDPANGGAETLERGFSPDLPDLSKFDLTVGEALEAFQMENRKIPSIRTLQRYCQEGQIDCYKLTNTRNDNPVHEWIIDSTSLWEFIQSCPQDSTHFSVVTPEPSGDAKIDAGTCMVGKQPVCVATAPDLPCDAMKAPTLPETSEREPDVTAALVDVDGTKGGQLSRVELLIENARLTAQLDAQSELVSELRADKRFMREEIARYRNNDRLLAEMDLRILQTLKAVSVAGRHRKLELMRRQRPWRGRGRNRIGIRFLEGK